MAGRARTTHPKEVGELAKGGATNNMSDKNPIGNSGFPTVKAGSVKKVAGSNKILTGKDLRTGKGN